MKKLVLSLVSIICLSSASWGQGGFGRFISYNANVQMAFLNNKQYGTETAPRRLHVGGGLGLSASINEQFNLCFGINYLLVSPENTRSDYSFCKDYPNCFPEVKSNQLHLPIGFEYYSNTDRSPFQSFYTLHFVPFLSVTEVMNITPFDANQVAQPQYTIKDNGVKFQDMHVQIAINNEFSLNENYKIYIEPSMSHTVLFKKEDVVNPDYIISLKIGFKYRGESGS